MQNVKFKRKNRIEKNRRIAPVWLILTLGWVGCNGGTDSICREFPQVAGELEAMQIQIAGLDLRANPKRAGKNRRIASVDAPLADEIVDHRDAWMEWGEKTLKRTQWAKDALENDKRGRKAVPALNDASLALVSFHGFLEQEKWRKANLELEKVEENFRRARRIACNAPEEAPKAEPKRAPASKKDPPAKKKSKRAKRGK